MYKLRILWKILKKVSYAHQACIYLIKIQIIKNNKYQYIFLKILFQDSSMNRKFKKNNLTKIEIFSKIINVFTIDQFITLLLNKSIHLN